MLQPGDEAPTLTLKTVNGQETTLAALWRKQNVLLVFLRHLG